MGSAAVLSVNQYMAPSEAARRLGVSTQRVRQLIDAGRLSAVVTPLGRLLPVADVDAEVRRRRRGRGATQSAQAPPGGGRPVGGAAG